MMTTVDLLQFIYVVPLTYGSANTFTQPLAAWGAARSTVGQFRKSGCGTTGCWLGRSNFFAPILIRNRHSGVSRKMEGTASAMPSIGQTVQIRSFNSTTLAPMGYMKNRENW